MKINKELLEANGYKKGDIIVNCYSYNNGQITFNEIANRKSCDWCMHLYNEDYESVAAIDVIDAEEADEFSWRLIGIKAFENYE